MFPKPNQFRNSKADIQVFYASGNEASGTNTFFSWTKPPGVSQIYMMLIGGGGSGGGPGNPGAGSGAVTTWFGAAQNVPDYLQIKPGVGGSGSNDGVPSLVNYYASSGAVNLLTADSGKGNAGGNGGGVAMIANNFAASGFFQSVAGQDGSTGSISASTTTFLSGSGTSSSANYGYTTTKDGTFQMQPIIVGCAGTGNSDTIKTGVGCGGAIGSASGGKGGQGLVLIASW